MLLINKLTKPGTIRRVELRLGTVRVVLTDGTEYVYVSKEPRPVDTADYGYLDSVADARGE